MSDPGFEHLGKDSASPTSGEHAGDERDAETTTSDQAAVGKTAASLASQPKKPKTPRDPFAPIKVSTSVGANRAASLELQRILASGELSTVERALEAVEAAIAARPPREAAPMGAMPAADTGSEMTSVALTERSLAPPPQDTISFSSWFTSYSFASDQTTTDAALVALEFERDRLSGVGVNPAWEKFAEQFNQKFAGILNAFSFDTDKAAAARNPVNAARLVYLFTPKQRDALVEFFATGVIPERLFNGSEVGRTTAAQRVLMAGQILVTGKYQPGSYEQRVHALACFHWARITFHYAGATSTAAKGVTGSFDHDGGALLATGAGTELVHARRDDKLSEEEAAERGEGRWRFGEVKFDVILLIQPGDWLYIYNGNKASANGAHSVIFAGWDGDTQGEGAGRTRRAMVYDQGGKEAGGGISKPTLGERVKRVTETNKDGEESEKITVKTVSQIMRMNDEAAPAQTVDDITPDKRMTASNAKWIKGLIRARFKGKQFDLPNFHAWLKRDNEAEIAKLASHPDRLTEGQVALLREANASTDEHTLVSLNQRVTYLAHNSDILQRMDDANISASDEKMRASIEWVVAENTPLQADVDEYQGELRELEVQETLLGWKKFGLSMVDHADEIKRLKAERIAMRAERRTLRKKTDQASLDKKAQLSVEITAKEAEIARLRAAQRAADKGEREAKQEIKKLDAKEAKIEGKVSKLEDRMDKNEAGLKNVEAITHAGKKSDQLMEKVDGGYDGLIGVPWETFMIEGPPK